MTLEQTEHKTKLNSSLSFENFYSTQLKHNPIFMVPKNGLRVYFGPIILVLVSYLIYFLRYPLWNYFTSIEPIFFMLILSYTIVLFLALLLLKKDAKKPLKTVFKLYFPSKTILISVFFVVFYYLLLYLINYLLGAKFEFSSFESIHGFETYTVYSVPLGYAIYLLFAVFGAFAEEVSYRGYVQTYITSKKGFITGVVVSTLLFSLQHIHVFQQNWLTTFFQTQFIHVLIFGAFVGYLYFKTKQNIWSVFTFHALSNVFNIALPTITNTNHPWALQIADITSIAVTFILLKHLLKTDST